MAISAQDVKRLREATGVGMMECKKALAETNGDFEAAIELLRKKGQKVAAKRADRDAKEGLVVTASSGDGKIGVLAEVNCETDFVARNEDFQNFANSIVELVLEKQPKDRDALLALPFGGSTVADSITDMTGKIGEKIDVRRIAIVESAEGTVVPYIHPGSRLGVLVDISGTGDAETVGRDIAMQVAALNPLSAHREGVPTTVVEKEMEIAREVALAEGKPAAIVDKIASGKLERYYKDNVLTEQPFVKDASIRVADLLKSAGLSVKLFVRFALGD
jgi:elongation factor Ts